MKLIIFLILFVFQISVRAQYTVMNFTARVDTENLDHLSEMADRLTPGKITNDEYERFRTNVEMFLITNGIFFTFVERHFSSRELMKIDENAIDPNFKTLRPKNPLLEKVILDIISTNADTFFSGAKSSGFYLSKSVILALIPGINVISTLARGQGSYHKELEEQSAKFMAMQSCSLKNMTDDPGILRLQSGDCETMDQNVLKSYKFLVSGLYALGFLLKNHKAHFGTDLGNFALGTNICDVITKKIVDPVKNAKMNGGWVYDQSVGLLVETSFCWRLPM